mmetsp:Transcript_3633/g.12394  ORF Transcript_3633/g.12394 Transcript_3633/m.12394 type:complete len:300 (-) Transcript_3633:942-1841(-)
MEDMHPHGRMSTNIGFSVTIVLLCSAWWSITPTMFAIGIAGFSCDCCWKSTRHTFRSGLSASRSSTGGGKSTPQCSSANCVSVLISLARAGTPPYSSAAPIAPAMLSRSVMMCPTKTASSSNGKNASDWPFAFGRCLRRVQPSSQCSSTACSSAVSSRLAYVVWSKCFIATDGRTAAAAGRFASSRVQDRSIVRRRARRCACFLSSPRPSTRRVRTGPRAARDASLRFVRRARLRASERERARSRSRRERVRERLGRARACATPRPSKGREDGARGIFSVSTAQSARSRIRSVGRASRD